MSVQWPLVIFTLFISLGAGILFVTGILAMLGKDKEVRFPALTASIIAIGVGGCASAFHLQHIDRIFNGFGHITSGITQELIFIVVAVLAIGAYFVAARKGDTPKWIGIVSIIAALLLVVFMSHSYAMASHPAWDTLLMYAFYLGGTFLLGTISVLAIQGFVGADTVLLAKLATAAGAIQTVIIVAYGFFITTLGGSYTSVGTYFDSTEPMKEVADPTAIFAGFLTGDNALLFWAGAVLVGAVAPLFMGFFAMKRPGKQMVVPACIGVICALFGGIAFRIVLYNLGYSAFIIF